MTTGTESFYASLPSHGAFAAVTRSDSFTTAPRDWWIALTDVTGSTKAIEQGRYKDVNLVGASTIIAVLNALGGLDVPYVFGGDGATLLIPPSRIDVVRRALEESRDMAQTGFGLELRAALLPIQRVRDDGFDVSVAKISVSKGYLQSSFSGGGLARADAVVKDAALGAPYLITTSRAPDGQTFEGLECRWSDLRTPGKQIVSLLIVALSPDAPTRGRTYERLLAAIDRLSTNAAPVSLGSLKLTFSPLKLLKEIRVRASRSGWWSQITATLDLWVKNLAGMYFFSKPGVRAGTDWQGYRRELLENTDSRKFDDTLRMVLSLTTNERDDLERLLKEASATGDIAYGWHVADHALMTCLVFNRQGHHVHFVDGGDGGYAVAAKALKEALKRRV